MNSHGMNKKTTAESLQDLNEIKQYISEISNPNDCIRNNPRTSHILHSVLEKYSEVYDDSLVKDYFAQSIGNLTNNKENQLETWTSAVNIDSIMKNIKCKKMKCDEAEYKDILKILKSDKMPILYGSYAELLSDAKFNFFDSQEESDTAQNNTKSYARSNQLMESSSRVKRNHSWDSKKEDQADFRTAAHQLNLDQQKQNNKPSSVTYGNQNQKRSLGTRRGVTSKFVPPVKRDEDGDLPRSNSNSSSKSETAESQYTELLGDQRLKNVEPKMVELIMNEIMDNGPSVTWDDIAGLQVAKNTIQEIVIWPMLRPDLFTGLRGPPKGILLFGPPGTGKTMIGKCIASQSESTFFSISASSLTSKWIGDGEKMVRALFAVARCYQPAVIFIDEIDSLLTQRSDTEHESSRRMKTEFLVQLDGATCINDERILVVGATNRPQELDEAARRRLVKRLYIPLPNSEAREQIIRNLLKDQGHSLDECDVAQLCNSTDGYSGADVANLCREAALGPIREIGFSNIKHITASEVRPISAEDFTKALKSIRASVSDKDLELYEDWNSKYGIVNVN